MYWMRDWYAALEILGFKKLSYSKERHFHGLSLVKVEECNVLTENERSVIREKLYILHDKHDLETLEQ